jgi:hypothetical protein
MFAVKFETSIEKKNNGFVIQRTQYIFLFQSIILTTHVATQFNRETNAHSPNSVHAFHSIIAITFLDVVYET